MTTEESTGKKKQSTSKKNVSLKNEVEQLKQELKENKNHLLRSIADFQNYQKRMERELKLLEDEIKRKYLSELIDLNELLKKAYEDENPKEGLKLMLENIEKFFEKEEIKYIECIGKKFDHNLHHAVTALEKENCDDDIIVEEVKKGYMVNGKLLRPSQVIVAKKKEK
ncbi:MAG: nucleotide exchange factor GrpE [Thermoplasmatales archaeon]|nr:MAG: nucleotide exchange factor GrpE [Thermoplasmatales archaeon]